MQSFTEFEHEGWERVAGKYDSVWASSTRQFIPPLLDATAVLEEMSVLDVGCGPGYVSAAAAARGARPRGLDFSREMIGIAQRMFPEIEFQEGDAQNLPFVNATFDRVLANFALLHVPDPGRVCAEACRILKPGGKFGFTVWAAPEENPYAS
jgi:ubiquinone/menaquinone biosynthesis C-methylase UbiE